MTVALKPEPATALVRIGDAELTPAQIELLKNTVAKGATNDELQLFQHVCNKTQLDPFARQIYAIKRRTKNDETQKWEERLVFQVSIDGFRLIAERSGKYAGQTPATFFDAAGNERGVWLDRAAPRAARVGVYRKGSPEPIYVVALWDEYVQTKSDGTPTKQWKEKPTIMLAKCAEAAALRKAFPQELSGLYAHEEMASQDESDEVADRPVSHTRARVVEAKPTVDSFGDITLTFGSFNGRLLSSLSYQELNTQFLKPWEDPKRRATAAERLGIGFVKAVEAEAVRKLNAPEAVKESARMARLLERRGAGEKLTDDELEDVRQYEEIDRAGR